ncbi:Sec-independent protein translocase subunit TatA [Allorhizocola rhizosphaerae]|uniref:Sec-independent protein translocase subunit TatA n=1 Tax=Allorhizocola rhizosphaerae TaxID=1872709 RepID=UPI000E3C29BB|nr:Sec-independent protein translocase subunit TatA [Allorhizocola rhizosphaerae]
MGVLQPWHIFVLIGVLVLLFGAKKLPDAARSLGRSMRILKAETKGMSSDSKDSVAEKADAQVTEQKPLADNQPSPAPKVDPIQHP